MVQRERERERQTRQRKRKKSKPITRLRLFSLNLHILAILSQPCMQPAGHLWMYFFCIHHIPESVVKACNVINPSKCNYLFSDTTTTNINNNILTMGYSWKLYTYITVITHSNGDCLCLFLKHKSAYMSEM